LQALQVALRTEEELQLIGTRQFGWRFWFRGDRQVQQRFKLHKSPSPVNENPLKLRKTQERKSSWCWSEALQEGERVLPLLVFKVSKFVSFFYFICLIVCILIIKLVILDIIKFV